MFTKRQPLESGVFSWILLMGSQFWYFRQLLNQHMEEGRMLTWLQAILDFTNVGWRYLCDSLN